MKSLFLNLKHLVGEYYSSNDSTCGLSLRKGMDVRVETTRDLSRQRQRRAPRKSPSSTMQYDVSDKSFAFGLCCPYLTARDILALSLTCSSTKMLLRNGGARTLRANISETGMDKSQKLFKLLTRSFPHAKEVILMTGNRQEVFGALKGCAHLQLTRLSMVLSDSEDASLEPMLDGKALSVAIAGFPLLERLEIRNVGPLSPWSFLKLSSSESLQMLRLIRCPTLMDSCLLAIVSQSCNLRELSVEECPCLTKPVLKSHSLVRIRLAHCFSLRQVNVSECPNLLIFDVPYTISWVEAPCVMDMPMVRHISLAGGLNLTSLDIDRLPDTLSSIDLGMCPKLQHIALGHCVGLLLFNVNFCRSLQTLILKEAHLLEELDLSLLENLACVSLTEDFSLRRMIIFGCDQLAPKSLHASSLAKRIG